MGAVISPLLDIFPTRRHAAKAANSTSSSLVIADQREKLLSNSWLWESGLRELHFTAARCGSTDLGES